MEAKEGRVKNIEDDLVKLKQFDGLIAEYWAYVENRPKQPLAAETVALVGTWVADKLKELGG